MKNLGRLVIALALAAPLAIAGCERQREQPTPSEREHPTMPETTPGGAGGPGGVTEPGEEKAPGEERFEEEKRRDEERIEEEKGRGEKRLEEEPSPR